MTDQERAAYYGDTGDLGGANLLWLSKTLDCGHRVEASEESGGFDEVPVVTEAMVRELLDFKIKVHDCERTEARRQRAQANEFRYPVALKGGPF